MTDELPDRSRQTERRAWHTETEWGRLRERIESAESFDQVRVRRTTIRPVRMAWLAAAAGVAGIAIALSWRFATRDAPPAMRATTHTATTAAGERIVIHLADSSLVTLGPSSSVQYAFTKVARTVDLVGLADFKVVHDGTRPFTVRARNAVATDLGTEFVVRAYPSDSDVQVAVTSGSVSLAGRDSTRAIQLTAGTLGRVDAGGTPSPTSGGNASAHAAWIDGRLLFDDESLFEVAADLSRWFDVDIRVPNAALARRRVTAVYNRPTLAGVLEALAVTIGASYEKNGRVVTLVPRRP